MSKTIRLSLAMDFYVDEDPTAEELTPEQQIEYFKEVYLDELAEGIMRNYIEPDNVTVEVINE